MATDTEQKTQHNGTRHRVPLGRIAAASVAVGGLSASALAAGTAGAASHAAKKVVVSTAKNAEFGKILVSGKTLYTLKAAKTPCTAACVKVWPELLLPKGVKKATAGKGVNSSKLGSVKRAGGVRQVTYSGKPLYWFVGDTTTGQANGSLTDTWGKWSPVVTVKPAAASSPTSTAPPVPSPTPTTVKPSTTTTTRTPSTSPTPTTSPPAPTTTTSPPPTTTTTTVPTGGGISF